MLLKVKERTIANAGTKWKSRFIPFGEALMDLSPKLVIWFLISRAISMGQRPPAAHTATGVVFEITP